MKDKTIKIIKEKLKTIKSLVLKKLRTLQKTSKD